MGNKQHTTVQKNTTSCVFDETLFFNFRQRTREELRDAVIKVSVFDAGTIGRDELIGEYVRWFVPVVSVLVSPRGWHRYDFDVEFVYFRTHHEVRAAMCFVRRSVVTVGGWLSSTTNGWACPTRDRRRRRITVCKGTCGHGLCLCGRWQEPHDVAAVRYLKLNIIVLGPGDRLYVHDPSEDVKQV